MAEDNENRFIESGKKAYKENFLPTIYKAGLDLLSTSLYAMVDLFLKATTDQILGKDSNYIPRANGSKGVPYGQISTAKASNRSNASLRSSEQLLELTFSDQEAREMESYLKERIRQYQRVSVGAYYEKYDNMLKDGDQREKITTQPSDFRYGWKNEADINYTRRGGACIFTMPTPKSLQ